MGREVYIIEKDGNIVANKITAMPGEKEFLHSYYLVKYMNKNNIPHDDSTLSYTQGEVLSKNGISTILIDNNLSIVFLPEFITEYQSYTFNKIKKFLSRYKVMYEYIDGDETVSVSLNYLEGETTKINSLYKQIKKNREKDSEKNGNRKIGK